VMASVSGIDRCSLHGNSPSGLIGVLQAACQLFIIVISC